MFSLFLSHFFWFTFSLFLGREKRFLPYNTDDPEVKRMFLLLDEAAKYGHKLPENISLYKVSLFFLFFLL
jgi:hypothetical protein